MTRPTAEQIRAEPAGRWLDMWVELMAFGREVWRNPIGDEWRLGKDRRGDLGMIRRFSTDPAACAELRRHLWASGWDSRVDYEQDEPGFAEEPIISVLITKWGRWHKQDEPVGTDPIAAECVALAKVALLASLNETAPAERPATTLPVA